MLLVSRRHHSSFREAKTYSSFNILRQYPLVVSICVLIVFCKLTGRIEFRIGNTTIGNFYRQRYKNDKYSSEAIFSELFTSWPSLVDESARWKANVSRTSEKEGEREQSLICGVPEWPWKARNRTRRKKVKSDRWLW